jgi:hypothetical protein
MVRVVTLLLLLGTACGSAPELAAVQAPAARDARSARVEALLGEGRELLRQHRPSDAESKLRQAVDQAYGFGAPWSRYRADALSELARAVLAQGRTADAQSAVAEALTLLKPGALDADQRISELETTRAEALLAEAQAGVAAQRFAVAVQAAARHGAELAPAQVAISLRLAQTLQALGRHQDAKKALEGARSAAQERSVGDDLRRRLTQALAQAEPAAAPASADASAAHEMVALQADFRACYRSAAQDHADVSGRVALVLSIEADGHVSSVKADASGLPVSAIDCLKRRALLARFDPPKGGATVITVPVTFVKQEND